MFGISLDVWAAAKDMIQYLKKRRERNKIPVGQFIKIFEGKYKIKLSKQSKIDLIESLRDEGIIILTSKNGRKYIVYR